MFRFLRKGLQRLIPTTPASRATKPEAVEDDVVPSLAALLRQHQIAHPDSLVVPVDAPETVAGQGGGRPHQIPLRSDTGTVLVWTVDSLRSLFRGQKLPPPDEALREHPEPYLKFVLRVEGHLLNYCDAKGDPTDNEIIALFSGLRRRPDSHTGDPLRTHLWRALCLELGTRPYSEAEYEALLRFLERTARMFRTDLVSRRYLHNIRRVFDRANDGLDEEEES